MKVIDIGDADMNWDNIKTITEFDGGELKYSYLSCLVFLC